jgi:DNA repair protein RadD
MVALRDYQLRAVQDVDAAWLTSRSVLLVLPTGAGKGTIAAHVLRTEVEREGRPLLLVHREEIVRDVARRVGADVATLVAGRREGPAGARILCASVQSLTRTELSWRPTLLLTDEAHHAVAATYRALYARYPDVRHLGLTATPMRSDRVRLNETYDELVTGPSPAQLRDAGWLVPVEVVSPHAYGSLLCEAPALAWSKWAKGRQTLVFTSTVDEAERLAASWPASAAVVHSATGSRARSAILKRFAARELTTIINVFVLTEGTDLPAAEVCLIARGCDSPATYLQMVGRVLRPCEGKTSALVIDLRGVVHAHGLPYDERTYSLEGLPISRPSTALALATCKSCMAVFRVGPKICPRCLVNQPRPPAPRVERRELVSNPTLIPEAEKAAHLRALLARCSNPKQAAVIYRKKYGRWPTRQELGQ